MINDSKIHNSEDKVLFGLYDLNIMRSLFLIFLLGIQLNIIHYVMNRQFR